MNKLDFRLDYLDHVGIQVTNLEKSIQWYREVLGLKEYRFPKWGDYPVFMLQNNIGIALFSASEDAVRPLKSSNRRIEIDHFAFRVSAESYAGAIDHFRAKNISFYEKDHHYFQSVYLHDLDGHVVELTYIKVDEEVFYSGK